MFFYTPDDIARYFLLSDFSLSYENKILADYRITHRKWMTEEQKNNWYSFLKKIHYRIGIYQDGFGSFEELHKITDELGLPSLPYKKDDYYDEEQLFFKLIRLQLKYSPGIEYKKIKLRVLMNRFGYKRRSEQLIARIENYMIILHLQTFLRNKVPYRINEFKYDDIIIFRLLNDAKAF